MADINKFLRSKDRLTEIHNYLINNNPEDLKTSSYIDLVAESIKVIDDKMEEFKRRNFING